MSQSLGHIVLNGARALLRSPDDWVQDAFRQGNRRCIDQAIMDSARQIATSRTGRRAAARAARHLIYAHTDFRNARDIHRWNDDTRRTHADVIGLLDRCAA